MENIPHKVRWWIALIADLLVLIPSGVRSGFWRAFDGINAWTYLFLVACLGLLALGIVWFIEYLNRRFSMLDTDIKNGLAKATTDLRDGLVKAGQSQGGFNATAMQMDDNLEKRLNDRMKALEEKIPSAVTVPEIPLRGRVWKLIEDLQGFGAETGAKPQFNSADQDSPTEIALWGIKLQCGFEMNFSERLKRIYCELGVNGFLPVTYAPRETVQNQEELYEVIDFLRKRVAEITVQQLGGAA
jgi:hypothetical protein